MKTKYMVSDIINILSASNLIICSGFRGKKAVVVSPMKTFQPRKMKLITVIKTGQKDAGTAF